MNNTYLEQLHIDKKSSLYHDLLQGPSLKKFAEQTIDEKLLRSLTTKQHIASRVLNMFEAHEDMLQHVVYMSEEPFRHAGGQQKYNKSSQLLESYLKTKNIIGLPLHYHSLEVAKKESRIYPVRLKLQDYETIGYSNGVSGERSNYHIHFSSKLQNDKLYESESIPIANIQEFRIAYHD